jgi:hypothetical protein
MGPGLLARTWVVPRDWRPVLADRRVSDIAHRNRRVGRRAVAGENGRGDPPSSPRRWPPDLNAPRCGNSVTAPPKSLETAARIPTHRGRGAGRLRHMFDTPVLLVHAHWRSALGATPRPRTHGGWAYAIGHGGSGWFTGGFADEVCGSLRPRLKGLGCSNRGWSNPLFPLPVFSSRAGRRRMG